MTNELFSRGRGVKVTDSVPAVLYCRYLALVTKPFIIYIVQFVRIHEGSLKYYIYTCFVVSDILLCTVCSMG